MLLTLAHIRTEYGSVERYVTDKCGLSPAAVAQIRRNMVVDIVDIVHDETNRPLDWEAHAGVVREHVAAVAKL